jgi:hypothetical protein
MVTGLDNDIRFTLSNASVKLVLDYFNDCKYNIKKLKARRSINSKNPESTTTEVLITNYN